MSENAYQNQDLENQNPLRVSMDSTTGTKVATKKFALPQDPKMKLLFILLAIVIFLFALSLIITLFKGVSKSPVKPTPTPIMTVTQLPTEMPSSDKIPENMRPKFNQVDQNSQININFNPPQIDPDVGL